MNLNNWYQISEQRFKENLSSYEVLIDAYKRETEGRKTRWDAEVYLENGKWSALVERRTNVTPRKALHSLFSGDGKIKADGSWCFTSFDSKESAMAHVEEYLKIRRDPNTWRGNQSERLQQRLSELESIGSG